jgi:tRNA-splicing ligase RtcB
MKIINDEKIPIKMWLNDIEEGALKQARNLANFPFAFRHIALMPDAHQGYGMPIGGVLAARDVIIPNAVGVDIGCGMCAVRTDLETIEIERLKAVTGTIRRAIPVGFKHHSTPRDSRLMPHVEGEMPVADREYNSALHQLGTLGGGNHFIEIQKGSDGFIWIMIHSGSRNIGKKVADHYNRLASDLNKKQGRGIPREWQLSFLDINSPEGILYTREMNYCINFALANRLEMMKNAQEIVSDIFSGSVQYGEIINIAHNYADIEEHYSEKVVVHRKGATRAFSGQTGIIPGSQGSQSYIVRGKGNRESFMSCSHGAGRKMGRKEAMRRLDLEQEKKKLDKMGILHSIRGVRDLDEATGAYKDISVVMKNQADLVEIEIELSPLAVIKG